MIRLKRHRDKLVRELAEARLELQGAQHRAAEVQVGCCAGVASCGGCLASGGVQRRQYACGRAQHKAW